MRTGTKRSVRTKIIVLLLAPLVTVVGLWAFVASITINDARTQLRTKAILRDISIPLTAVDSALQLETILSVTAMATSGPNERAALAKQRGGTLATGDREFKQLEKDITITWL